ncbi:MAG: class I SAM-dependent methyltransferase [Shimia sp.]
MRLRLALGEGLTLEGPCHVHLPPVGYDVSALSEPHIFTPNWTVAQAFSHLPVNTEAPPAGAHVIVAPREKALARDVIARCAALGGTIVVDGQRTDGIDSLCRACRKLADVKGSVTKAHGRLFWMEATAEAFADWRWRQPEVFGFTLAPGVFSADGIDPGSLALAEALPEQMTGRVIDLGAGWGYLSAVAQHRGADHVDLVEVNAMALACARQNVELDRAAFHWHDVATWEPRALADHVVMNPPFHTGRSGAPELGQTFIRKARACLGPRGILWMVANRHLPYEETLAATFAEVEEQPVRDGFHGYKVFRATRPRR